jgi:hypothetical protein
MTLRLLLTVYQLHGAGILRQPKLHLLFYIEV